MANRNFNTVQALEKQVKELHFAVAISGSGQVSSTTGLGGSGSLQAGSIYRITLEDTYPKALAVQASWQPATTSSANLSVQPQIVKVDTTSSVPHIDFCLVSGSAAGKVGAGVEGTAFVSVFARNSVVG